MTALSGLRSVGVLSIAAWLGACASGNIRPATDHAGQPISEEDIRAEMRVNSRVKYGLGLGLAGAAAGILTGGTIGYRIGYSRDTARGCEDCGLDGLIMGSLIGVTVGATLGAILGSRLGYGKDREAAVERIRRRRLESGQSARPANVEPAAPCDPTSVGATGWERSWNPDVHVHVYEYAYVDECEGRSAPLVTR